MHSDLLRDFEKIADKSVAETIEAFLKYPSGFHGDTGLQHYLYHRILSNASSRIYWTSPSDATQQTLIFQSEIYTKCTYKKTGVKAGRGRFDMAFIEPPRNVTRRNTWSQNGRKAVIAFEVGRNKRESWMGEYRAPQEKSDPQPGDAAKIIRDLRFGGLKGGYILEFFDQSQVANAQMIAKKLSNFLDSIEKINCHLAIAVMTSRGNPLIWLYPSCWLHEIELNYKKMDLDQSTQFCEGSPIEGNINHASQRKCENLWQEPDFTIVQGTVGSSARYKNKPRLWFLPKYFQIAPHGKGNDTYEVLRKTLCKYFNDVRGESRVVFSSSDFSWDKFKDFVMDVKSICKR